MFNQNENIWKKIPFQPFCDLKENKYAKNTHFHTGGGKK